MGSCVADCQSYGILCNVSLNNSHLSMYHVHCSLFSSVCLYRANKEG